MKLKLLLHGITTFLPGLSQYKAKGTGGTDSARYCYSVWLRHLVMARQNGLDTWPKTVAELGPGDSLGIGLAALISGCDRYYAFDVVEHATTERNVAIFDELVTLFENRTPIPGNNEFPNVKPHLDTYEFPHDIFPEARLREVLQGSRLAEIRAAITAQEKRSPIQYKVPWYQDGVLERESVDMIYSQAVLEHVDDLHGTYQAMWKWLKPIGYISHQIDFKSHGTAEEWNGHWRYSDLTWKLIRGRRPYLINREPHSTHIRLLKETGFEILCDIRYDTPSSLQQHMLASRFRSMSDEDLTTSGAFIQAVKGHKGTIENA